MGFSASLRFTVFIFFVLSIFNYAFAETREYTVFDARKTLPLADDAPVYRDYYVNMGVEAGVKVGSILAVYRKIPIVDIYTNKAPGDLIVQVAKLQVIQTQRSLSVGRVLSQSNPKSIPVVQFEKVMLGDRVDLTADQASGPASERDDDDKTE